MTTNDDRAFENEAARLAAQGEILVALRKAIAKGPQNYEQIRGLAEAWAWLESPGREHGGSGTQVSPVG